MSIDFTLTTEAKLRQFDSRVSGIFFYNGDQRYQVISEMLDDKSVPLLGKATTLIDGVSYEMHGAIAVRVKEAADYARECEEYDEAKEAADKAGHGYIKEKPSPRLDSFVFLVATTNVNTRPPHHSAYAKGEFLYFNAMDVSDHFNHAFFQNWLKNWLSHATRSEATV